MLIGNQITLVRFGASFINVDLDGEPGVGGDDGRRIEQKRDGHRLSTSHNNAFTT